MDPKKMILNCLCAFFQKGCFPFLPDILFFLRLIFIFSQSQGSWFMQVAPVCLIYLNKYFLAYFQRHLALQVVIGVYLFWRYHSGSGILFAVKLKSRHEIETEYLFFRKYKLNSILLIRINKFLNTQTKKAQISCMRRHYWSLVENAFCYVDEPAFHITRVSTLITTGMSYCHD